MNRLIEDRLLATLVQTLEQFETLNLNDDVVLVIRRCSPKLGLLLFSSSCFFLVQCQFGRKQFNCFAA